MSDLMRDEFEAEWLSRGNHSDDLVADGGGYTNDRTYSAFYWWQASRASMIAADIDAAMQAAQ